jgi:hypothetical protein
MEFRRTLGEFILCSIGLHNWYLGSFSGPVWGRTERHCLDCKKMQYRHFDEKKKKSVWVSFKYEKTPNTDFNLTTDKPLQVKS